MIRLKEIYKPLFTSPKRYFIVTGGRGSGKSFHVATFLCLLTFEALNRVLFTRYTMTSAEISIIPEFLQKIELLGVGGAFATNKTNIENAKTGSDILFRGIKTGSGMQTANLKSLAGVTTWVIDEAEELTDEATFDKIDMSIRQKDKHNRVIMVLNPTTKEHWIYKRFFEGHIKHVDIDGHQIPITTHPDVCHIHTTYLNNVENLSETFLNLVERLKITNPDKYAHTILGGWLTRAEGVIFGNWQEGAFDNTLPFCYGLDFGFFPDPTAMCKIAIDEAQKRIYIKELVYKQQLSEAQIIDAVGQHAQKHELIVADGAEQRIIDAIRAKGFNIQAATKGPGSVRRDLLQMVDYQIIIDPESQNAKKEANNYVWNDKKAGIPIDAHNHLFDAARYGFEKLKNPVIFYFK